MTHIEDRPSCGAATDEGLRARVEAILDQEERLAYAILDTDDQQSRTRRATIERIRFALKCVTGSTALPPNSPAPF